MRELLVAEIFLSKERKMWLLVFGAFLVGAFFGFISVLGLGMMAAAIRLKKKRDLYERASCFRSCRDLQKQKKTEVA